MGENSRKRYIPANFNDIKKTFRNIDDPNTLEKLIADSYNVITSLSGTDTNQAAEINLREVSLDTYLLITGLAAYISQDEKLREVGASYLETLRTDGNNSGELDKEVKDKLNRITDYYINGNDEQKRTAIKDLVEIFAYENNKGATNYFLEQLEQFEKMKSERDKMKRDVKLLLSTYASSSNISEKRTVLRKLTLLGLLRLRYTSGEPTEEIKEKIGRLVPLLIEGDRLQQQLAIEDLSVILVKYGGAINYFLEQLNICDKSTLADNTINGPATKKKGGRKNSLKAQT